MKKFCYLVDAIVYGVSVIVNISSGWSKLRDAVPLIASRSFPLGAKDTL